VEGKADPEGLVGGEGRDVSVNYELYFLPVPHFAL